MIKTSAQLDQEIADSLTQTKGKPVMTEREWQDRYMITSIKGKIWKRSELRNRAVKIAAALASEQPRLVIRTAVQLVLDDPGFMRFRSGMVPARVIEDAGMEAFLRIRRQEVKT